MKPVAWALHWLWDQPGISVILSGMSTMEQVMENVNLASESAVGMFTAADQQTIEKARDAYRSLRPVQCSGCRYCQPCPNGVDIPTVFEIYEDSVMYGDPRLGKFRYNGPFGINQDQRADKCTECGECLEKCPQKIDIPTWLKKAHEAMYSETPVGPPPPPSTKAKE
jgi:predicted aldo/keto reductase-like oxidoreductase